MKWKEGPKASKIKEKSRSKRDRKICKTWKLEVGLKKFGGVSKKSIIPSKQSHPTTRSKNTAILLPRLFDINLFTIVPKNINLGWMYKYGVPIRAC